ncbi:hypothetical protein MCHI_002719 [Candidatus Magnetoovum chiemensis]|nr:hypothetical protein MCHI_002719 [Candidatus Magnetoovum chiemensis]
MIETQERISRVESALERYIEITAQSQAHFEATVAQAQAKTEASLDRLSKSHASVDEALKKLSEAQAKTEASLDRLSKEMAEFKDEMAEFKDEMGEFKNEMAEFKNEMAEFKDEMGEFKNEMWNFKKESNKQWGELAKKLGTLVEDLLAPAIEPALKRYFKCEAKTIAQRMNRKSDDKSKSYEIDLIAVCDDIVFMVEEKATVRRRDIDYSIRKSKEFFSFFPEYNGKKLVLIIGTVAFPDDLVVYATRKGVYAMAYREWDYVDILNFDELQDRGITH